ncbi:DUF7151 family protein [Sorangium sp. So ce1099]|uniref:DUF7151 family protein n=1 Tax=Sorangium sp. So ce1099 TaxID=3133331 RepID=UPI003F61D59C
MHQDRPSVFAPLLLTLALASAACGSEPPAAPPAGDGGSPAPAVRIDDEPPGASCPEGGRAIHKGEDDDGDGVLDPGEIDATEYVCAERGGGDLPELLTTRAEEPPGEHCPHGGTAVRSGLDLDGDGALDAQEVSGTTYVCAGAPPEEPEEPEQTPERLVRIDEEPAGPNCVAGGAAVHAGLDDDGDGALGDDEIDHTDHVCGASLVGDHAVTDLDDLQALEGIRVITGTLTLAPELATVVSLPDLAYVGGSLDVEHAYVLERLELPALAHVGGDLSMLFVPALRSLSLPSLARVGGALGLSQVRQLAAVELPALTEVGARLEPRLDAVAIQADALAELAMPSLRRSGGGIHLRGAALERVAFPALMEVGRFELWDSLAVQALELPVLQEVRGDLIVWGIAAAEIALPRLLTVAGDLDVVDAQAAARLSLPELRGVGGTLVLARCAQLTDLELPRLASAPRFILRDQARLTSFSLPALATVKEQVGIWYNPSLTDFSLPALRQTEWLSLSGNPRLAGLGGLAQLESVSLLMTVEDNLALADLSGLAALSVLGGYLEISGNHAMTRVGLARLERAEVIDIGRVGISGNDRLEVVDMPALRRVDGLGISWNDRLTDLSLPSLARIPGGLNISMNPALPQCEAEALAAQLVAQPEHVYLGGNDDGGTCE